MRKIAVGWPEITEHGELTFVGALNKYFCESDVDEEAIAKPWGAVTTINQYINDYERRIVPNLNARKALSEYEFDDFLNALRSIKRDYDYTQVKMQHYRYLMWRVYDAATRNNEFESKIDWDFVELEAIKVGYKEENAAEKIRKKALLKKAFTYNENVRLLTYFKHIDLQKPRSLDIGLLLMYMYGLRNNEVAALDFQALVVLGEERLPCLIIRQSSLQDRREVKASGKTQNANRIIPLHDGIYNLLIQRKEYIMGEIPEVVKEIGIGKLPIVCTQFDLTKGILPRELSAAGKELFDKLKIGRDRLRDSQEDLFWEKLEGIDVGEKDPTSYVFRRNHATRLLALGLSRVDRQYLMGHDLEETQMTRSDYNNTDVLGKIKKILDKHPYNLYLFGVDEQETIIELSNSMYQFAQDSQISIMLEKGNKYLITVSALEPGCDIKIITEKLSDVNTKIVPSFNFVQKLSEEVNVRAFVNELYNKKSV